MVQSGEEKEDEANLSNRAMSNAEVSRREDSSLCFGSLLPLFSVLLLLPLFVLPLMSSRIDEVHFEVCGFRELAGHTDLLSCKVVWVRTRGRMQGCRNKEKTRESGISDAV